MRLRTMLTAVLLTLGVLAVPAPALAAGEPTDTNIEYEGRWSGAYVPQWAGAYLRVGFTGTSVALKQRGTIDFWYSIDGGAYTKATNVSGTVNLTPVRLAVGQHSLLVSYRIVAGSYTGDAVFQGLTLDAGANTYKLPKPAKGVEFVGDSITAGYTATNMALSAYPWIIGENLGVSHTQIALSGACLRELTAAQSTRGIRCYGLENRYTKTGFQDGAADWNFGRYQPAVVVVNIGTNDSGHGVNSADFRTGYTNLLRIVREKNPNARILALRIFKGSWAAETRQSVLDRQAAGDTKVTYVDSTGWWDGATMSGDGTHPNDYGHRVLAGKLQPFVSAALAS
ncbi:SGNH/GDSL hydrolase family protein [Actinoplanes derwentensis]|uniref:Lysophospholipase L1 n=1 Tax=Actinoplanes derwentensis TaxID=113562 RepID=A0A1H1YGW4_9ACTN|nr:SGNH/GDSL hydrolase family protein [Actinoplanes derwentensis]GID81137.1 endoglucanase [Actinoplanes derwentensis]SDT20585.1 Lysophospholipase L1 [Actinoplanes derwentensis]